MDPGCGFPAPEQVPSEKQAVATSELQRCSSLSHIERLLCRTEIRIERARQERDVIELNCLHDKLLRLRTIDRLVASIRSETRDDPAEERQARLSLGVAHEHADRVWRELEQCVSSYPLYVDSGWPDVELCTGTDPLPNESGWD